MAWDVAKLKSKTVHERHQLWLNAKAKMGTHAEAKELVQLIESSGLDYAKDKIKSVSLDDPIGRLMKRVIGSETGIRAMLEATEQWLPALAGVDPLLKTELGDRYSKHNEATTQAGYLVTGFMEGLGYEKVCQTPMPQGCVAKTGWTFKRRSKA
jgi:hypothetical protein